MRNIYERNGVRTVVNAAGPVTRLSGSIMPKEVAEAMSEASQHCVDIAELQAWAGKIIAEITGAEAGYVTSGAAAGLMLSTAACVTGLDPSRMNKLPDTSGMKNEVIMPRSHRNFYDHAIRAVGVRLIEVGIPDRFSGAGVRDTEAWEIQDAISENTAAVAYVASEQARPALYEVVAAAHAHDVPVIVDAAGQLPPQSHLEKFIAEGTNMFCFSGGKAIRGPQSTGILCGRRDLISAAALQNLDQDVFFDLWNPPKSLIDKSQLPGAPQHGIGRPCKVSKEDIIGIITALRIFVAEVDEVRSARWKKTTDELAKLLEVIQNISVSVKLNPIKKLTTLRVKLDEQGAQMSAKDLVRLLMIGKPSVHVDTLDIYDGVFTINPMCLRDGDARSIASRIQDLLGSRQKLKVKS